MNSIIILLALIVIVVLPDVYLLLGFLRDSNVIIKVLNLLPTIAFFALLFFLSRHRDAFMLGFASFLLLCIVLPKFLFVVISIIGRGAGFLWYKLFTYFNVFGFCVSAVVALAMLFGLIFGWRLLDVKNVDLAFDDLPEAFDGYTIVHLSDMHVGTYGDSPGFLQKVVDKTNGIKPDLIVFTGDIVNLSSEEIRPFVQTLDRFSATDGVVSVLGNHDYGLYSDDYADNPHEEGLKVADAEVALGWRVLMNEHIYVRRGNDSIAIIGVENTGKPPFPRIGDLRKAMEGVDSTSFSILLSHDPSHWQMEVLPRTDIPLMLSGHTHAAQFKICGWSPSRWLYDQWSGLYEEDGQKLLVSEGIGGTIPFRLGTKPQIVKITLHRKS